MRELTLPLLITAGVCVLAAFMPAGWAVILAWSAVRSLTTATA
jgi:hypothetical protein